MRNIWKKTTILATTCIIIAVTVFFELYVFKPPPMQQTIAVSTLTSDPSAWVNRTVVVEGNISAYNPPGWWDPPWNYELSSNATIGVFWQGNYNLYNEKNVIIRGVVMEGQWREMLANWTSTLFGPVVYFIKAERIEVL